ncbi:hypothetical protein [Amnibacterium kyonggiense]
MNASPGVGRHVRLRAATAAVCSLLVIAGGVLVTAPAQAAEPAGTCTTTTGDLPGGVVLPVGRITPGLVDCPGTAPSDTAPAGAATAPAPAPAPVDGTGSVPPLPVASGAPVAAGSNGAAPAEPIDGASVSASSSSSAAPVPDRLTVLRSSTTVYPVKDGYLDVVRFAVRETGTGGEGVPLAGTAVLRHAGRTVRTWTLRGMSAVIAWDGRVGTRIRPGLYTLRVAVRAPDGTVRTEDASVQVMPQRLAERTLTVRTDLGARSTTAELPKRLIGAYRLGRVRVATRTAAVVRGPAELIFTGDDGRRKAVRLRAGVHTTPPTVLPPASSTSRSRTPGGTARHG